MRDYPAMFQFVDPLLQYTSFLLVFFAPFSFSSPPTEGGEAVDDAAFRVRTIALISTCGVTAEVQTSVWSNTAVLKHTHLWVRVVGDRRASPSTAARCLHCRSVEGVCKCSAGARLGECSFLSIHEFAHTSLRFPQ